MVALYYHIVGLKSFYWTGKYDTASEEYVNMYIDYPVIVLWYCENKASYR